MGPIPPDFVADEGGCLLMRGKDLHPFTALTWDEITPVFLYDWSVIANRIERLRAAMPSELLIHYAVKANPFEPVVQGMASRCDGLDLASGGELEAVLRANVREIADERSGMARPTDRPLALSLAGPGKRDEELRLALDHGVTIHVESLGELARLLLLGVEAGVQPKVGVRVNPPFGLKGSGMKMGGLASPFGVDHDEAPDQRRGDHRKPARYRGSRGRHCGCGGSLPTRGQPWRRLRHPLFPGRQAARRGSDRRGPEGDVGHSSGQPA
jgi:diaminopimelate decarboxylase